MLTRYIALCHLYNAILPTLKERIACLRLFRVSVLRLTSTSFLSADRSLSTNARPPMLTNRITYRMSIAERLLSEVGTHQQSEVVTVRLRSLPIEHGQSVETSERRIQCASKKALTLPQLRSVASNGSEAYASRVSNESNNSLTVRITK